MRGNYEFSEGWRETTLGEVCENISRRFDFPNKKEVVFINTGDVLAGKFLHKKYISKIGLPGQAKKAIKKGDILYSEIRPKNKRYAIVDFEVDDFVVSTKFMVLKRNDKINLDFLYLFVTSEKILNEFNHAAESRSGTFPQITFDSVKYININLPPLQEQKAIASILSSFDEKIELFKEQNETLEQMAQGVFREWFVDGVDESWEVGTLGEIGKVITGKTPSTKQDKYWGKEVPFITPTDFKYFNKFTTKSMRYLSIDGRVKMINNILPKNSILVTCIGSDMGKVSISHEECITNQQINSLILNDAIFIEYTYQYLKFIYPILRNIALGGSTMPIINKTSFENIEIIIPSKSLLIKFSNMIKPINEKIKNNTNQIQTLQKTRDTLLPKLMSGEVRVDNA